MSAERALDAFYDALRDDDPERLYDRAPCGYLSTTPDGTIVKVNQTFLDLTGYARDDLVGRRTFASLLTPGGRIYHETHYAPMLRMQGSAREIALEVLRADGTRAPVLVNAVLDVDDDGTPSVVRAAVFDATERRSYERELLRAKRSAEESEARATALARTLQETLIPPMPPDVPGLDVAAAYRPAGSGDEVGGDFYDVFQVGDRDWVVTIGDVRGKGVDAAVVTALARYTLRAATVRTASPADALANLNDVLLAHHTERFCTVVLLRLRENAGSWSATVGVGGHPLPLLSRDGAALVEVGTPGSLLGVVPDPDLFDVDVALTPGDALVVYTDGVTEGRRDGDLYGDDRLRDSVVSRAGSAAAIADGVVADVLDFQGGDARDDIAVVVVRVP
jgi:sigma-B regulation protein RsbU (phosphoserine phosphatase)